MAKKAMSAEEIRNKFFITLDIQHPSVGLLSIKIKKTGGTAIALEAGIPLDNPLLAIVHDPARQLGEEENLKAKEELENLTPIELMRRIAKAVMVEPKYHEIEDLVKDDLFILAAISKEVTGLGALKDFLDQVSRIPEGVDPAPFRNGTEEGATK